MDEDFIEKHIVSLSDVPSEWEVTQGHYYSLDLRMLHLPVLKYEFDWRPDNNRYDREGTTPVYLQPDRILHLNISLNEISALDHQALHPLSQLRSLDASLNRISRYPGIEVLSNLCKLNLSYNCITALEGLGNCRQLMELNLNMNSISDISVIPTLSHLSILHISNNKLKSLDGIQGLPNLRELYVQKNQLNDILAVSVCFHLVVFNAAENQISSLQATVEALKSMSQLNTLTLQGNPIALDSTYRGLISEATSVIILDDLPTRTQPIALDNKTGGRLGMLKESVRQTFLQRLGDEKKKTENKVRFLQNRILDLQNDYKDTEKALFRDMDSCMSYLDNMPKEELQFYDVNSIQNQMRTLPVTDIPKVKPGQTSQPRMSSMATNWSPPENKKNENTDEVLRQACHKLVDLNTKALQ